MANYLIQVKYAAEGLKGVIKDCGAERKETAETVLASLDGKLEGLYLAFCRRDLFSICDPSDNVSASTLSPIFSSRGLITTEVTVLVTPEEIDSAVKMPVKYRLQESNLQRFAGIV